MNILLVANYEPDHQRSMARYAELLRVGLDRRGHHVEMVRPKPIFAWVAGFNDWLQHWLGYVDKFALFPPALRMRSRGFDVVHVCDHSNSFYLRWAGRTPALITAHDALAIRSALGHFPQNPTRITGVWLQHWILRNLAHASHIICVSEKTKLDFSVLLNPAPSMTVIPNILSEAFRPAPVAEVEEARSSCGLAATGEYLLHVGKDSWYKNRSGAVRIFAALRRHPRFANLRLVMAGDRLSDEMRSLAGQVGGVVECMEPSDSRLRALYSGALALLFPSLEEGFGWPILEAQACGCPVITSNRPPMPEVAGEAAILIDPEDAVEAAAAIAGRIGEAAALRDAGFANLSRYATESVLDRYCALYHELVERCGEARER